ncbi:MAG: hypothetical protein ACKV2V_00825 [Blastocatellia bacterium]
MEQLFRFFFKHSPTAYEKGQFGFAGRLPVWAAVLIALLIAALAWFLYFRHNTRLSSGWQWLLTGLRVGLVALLALMLLRPVITVPSIIPKSSYVAVLADDSRSMKIADETRAKVNPAPTSTPAAKPSATPAASPSTATPQASPAVPLPENSRLKALTGLLNEGQFTAKLTEKFKVNQYAFAAKTTRIKGTGELTGEGKSTDVAGALRDVVRDSTGLPLSALVLASDGAANTPRDLTAQLRELRSRNLPVFTIGLGGAEKFRDAEMTRVAAPRRILIGSTVIADALIRLNGFSNTRVAVAVSEDGRAVKTQQFDVKGNGESQTVTLEFTPGAPGWHRYTFAVTPLDNESTLENNQQESLIEVTSDQPKILYLEGEPRWEYGKMRFSLTKNEKNVILVSALRSADGKFYRQGVESGTDLESGFPKTAEEFFKYQGFMLGSVEANFFSYEQLKMIEQFVARRGGGFLALGGSRAYSAGRYPGTPVADLLPFLLSPNFAADTATPSLSNFKTELTPRGQTHAITRLAEDRAQSAKEWEQLPPISIPEVTAGVKPAATVLLEARDINNKSRTVPMLAEQRYGRGRSLALMTSDTWRWRMQMDAKNTSHENFWRQLLRYTISTTPRQTEIFAERDVYAASDPVILRGDVNDAKFEAVRDAQVVARITKPNGFSVDVPMQFDFSEEGNNYRAEFTPDENGLYKMELTARKGGAVAGAAASAFLVTDLNREFHDAAQNTENLKRIAAETGGKYYTLAEAGQLLEDIQYLEGKNSERRSLDLWDLPVNFLALITMAAAEWFLRKRRGLA